ncbi:MAG: CPBP family intramembrane metalloprotease [Oscillospiraceae bacterium]|nr:CPBP family intramembrane metalloprotease [Oscillospiraceae bacterium]
MDTEEEKEEQEIEQELDQDQNEVAIINDENLHSKAHGIIICIVLFIMAMVVLRLLPVMLRSFALELSWVWNSVIAYSILLILSIVFALALRQPLGKVFPFKKLEGLMFTGSLFTFLAMWCFSFVINILSIFLIPFSNNQTTESLFQLAIDFPLWVGIIAIGLLPGVVEELLCRGTMLYALRPLNRDWHRILIVGLLFGFMHGSISQIAYASVLGMGFAYIVIKTNNLFYPIFWHFSINSLSTTLMHFFARVLRDMQQVTQNTPTQTPAFDDLFSSTMMVSTLGYILSLALTGLSVGILFLLVGVRRLNRLTKEEAKQSKRRRRVKILAIVILIVAIASMFGSCALMVAEILM